MPNKDVNIDVLHPWYIQILESNTYILESFLISLKLAQAQGSVYEIINSC